MAKKKKEESLQYLQMPLPSGKKFSRMAKVSFGGLNKRYTIDSGALTQEKNISTNAYPYLTPSEQKEEVLSGYVMPISMSAFDDFIVVVYYDDNMILVDYIASDGEIHTGILETDHDRVQATLETPRSIVQFNVYDTPTDPLTGQFVKKLLFFPDKASMYMRIEKIEDAGTFDKDTADMGVMYYHYNNVGKKIFTIIEFEPETDREGNVTYTRVWKTIGDQENHPNRFICSGMTVDVKAYTNDIEPYLPPETASHNYYYRNLSSKAQEDDTLFGTAIYRWVEDESDSENSGWKISLPPTMPNIKYATVHLSRVFGVDDDRVYASGYNNYANWNLDTTDEYNESNSWCSPSQANTKAGGKFTGITTFDSHVICFKRDFMHEIYNTKNPFRLQDIYAEGCIDNRTIQNVDGKLIFVSEDDVKIYTGSNPRIIGYNLNTSQYTYAVSGTDNRNYYLYCEDDRDNKFLYVYDTYTELWSEQSIDFRVISFAHNRNGMYMLCEDGCVYKMDTNDYSHDWSCETDLITSQTVNIKHIKKLQMLADIAEDADMKVYILYDDEEFDENASHLVYASKKCGRLPIRVKPRKTANYGFKLHFEGTGYVKLYELEIFIEAGGDMYV